MEDAEKFIFKWLKKDTSKTLGRLRKHFKIGQETLARDLGLSYSTINAHENGRNKPHKLILREYSRYYAEKTFENSLDLSRILH